MVEWWAWVFVVIGISIFVIGGFSGSRRLKKGEHGWYRRGMDGADAKAHCFLYTGERVPLISFNRTYSLCRGKYLDPLGNWERIEDPGPEVMCTKCMDFIRRKKKDQQRV